MQKRPREINRKHLQILNKLGSGVHGDVFRGLLDEGIVPEYTGDMCTLLHSNLMIFIISVAVKTVKASAPREARNEMLAEAAVQSQFTHANVLSLIGVTTVGAFNICFKMT